MKRILFFMFPSLGDARLIVKIKNKDLEELCPNNWARALVVSQFMEYVLPLIDRTKVCRIAIIGGTNLEPELALMQKKGISCHIEYFGIESGNHLDLNEFNPINLEKFDLILCSQVFEHIWNHSSAIQNLENLLCDGGLLWLAAPASNRAHGSPSYYSAGYTSGYLSHNLEQFSFQILREGQIGSRRNYIALHVLPTWLSFKAHRNPVLFAFSEYSPVKRAFLRIRFFHWALALMLISGKISNSSRVASESWALAQKLNNS